MSDNAERASIALIGLAAYRRAATSNPADNSLVDPDMFEEAVSDLLTDLQHLCDQSQASFEALLERAGRRYLEEVTPPPRPWGVFEKSIPQQKAKQLRLIDRAYRRGDVTGAQRRIARYNDMFWSH